MTLMKQLRAHFLLLAATLLLCSVVYPLVVMAAGRVLAPRDDGHLVAQRFDGDEWFRPRPSAAGYNAAASSGSNWAASNPRLRDRVARQLGPVVRYVDGRPVGPDVERWFAAVPDRAATWAKEHPTLAAAWIAEHPETKVEPGPDAAVAFFVDYARANPGRWPAGAGADIQATFFDVWLRAHPAAELERVPGDAVTASGSGLDPHITVRNARHQLGRVAAARAKKSGADPARVRASIDEAIGRLAFAPLGGLVGEPLVNVLELNRAVSAPGGR